MLTHTLKLIIIGGLLILAGCDNKTGEENQTLTDTTAKIKTFIFKGMFNKDSMYLIECSAKKKFKVAPEGELIALEKVYELKPELRTSGEYYIETAGFTSVKENTGTKNFDTMLVVTRFIGLDTSFNCLK